VAEPTAEWGLDHGSWAVLRLMFPEAKIPVTQLSLNRIRTLRQHFELGQELHRLREQGVLIIGSGLSYHNMRGFGSSSSTGVSQQFGKWLAETVEESDISIRDKRLIEWEKAPAARQAHPREDHLLPLMLVAGAAGQERGRVAFVDHVMNVDMASYVFG
jgi:aromatic ring-opening dioxygenase catalytic subunit (LigB family)